MGDRDGDAWRSRLRMSDLMFGVLALGCAIGLVAPSRKVWATFEEWEHPILGAIATPIAVVLAMILCRRVFDLAMGSKRALWMSVAWPVAWRLAAVAGMVVLITEEAWCLRHGFAPEATSWTFGGRMSGGTMIMKMGMLPILLCMLMVGVMLASMPSPAKPRPRFPRLRLAMLPLSAIAGALMMGLSGFIPYLVLIAIDHVNLAMRQPYAVLDVIRGAEVIVQRAPTSPHAMLAARLARTGWDALGAGLIVTALAMLAVADLERRDRETLPGWRGIAARLVALIASAGAAVYLVTVSLPHLHRDLLPGLMMITEGWDVASVAIGFSGLAAGFAARAVARPDGPVPAVRSWPRRWLAVVLAILGFLALATQLIFYADSPSSESWWLGWVGEWRWLVQLNVGMRLSNAGFPAWSLSFVYLLWAGVFLWLAVATGSLLATRSDGPPAAMDSVMGSRLRWMWFVWCWMALSVVFLAAIPVLGLGGTVIIHLFTNGEDLFGWRI